MKEQFSDKVWQGIIDHTQPLGLANVKIVDVKPGYCKLAVKIDENNCNLYGFAHGGILFTLCDSASGLVTYASGYYNVTLDASINYIKSATKGEVYCVCKTLHQGRKTCINQVQIFSETKQLLTNATFTQYIKGKVE